MPIAEIIKSNPGLKKLVHWMLVPKNDYKPRLWVRWFLNPFIHKRGSGCIIRFNTRLDLLPFNKFKLGNRSIIEDYSIINNGVGDVFIGNDTIIGLSGTIIGPVQIGNNVMLAQNVVISGLNHGYEDVNTPSSRQPVITKKIIVSDDVWIGANAVITAGIKIGKHSVIGGGSVVTRDVPDYSVVAGNPAKLLKQYNFTTLTWDKV